MCLIIRGGGVLYRSIDGYVFTTYGVVAVVRSGRMSGQPRVVAGSRHDGGVQAVTRGELGSLSRALNESGTVCKVCYWELPEL